MLLISFLLMVWLASFLYITQDQLSRSVTAHSGWILPYQSLFKKMSLQTCLQVNHKEGFSQLQSLPQMTLACIRLTESTNIQAKTNLKFSRKSAIYTYNNHHCCPSGYNLYIPSSPVVCTIPINTVSSQQAGSLQVNSKLHFSVL